jgi:hypothetical protein
VRQRVKNAWQSLAFFSKKLNPAQQKYCAYDRGLLAIYKAVKHFRHILEARHFTIFTDHKPIYHLRLPAETGQMLTKAIQPSGFHTTIHDRYPTHL